MIQLSQKYWWSYQAKAGHCNLIGLSIVNVAVLLNVPGKTLCQSLLESRRVQDTWGNQVEEVNEGGKASVRRS